MMHAVLRTLTQVAVIINLGSAFIPMRTISRDYPPQRQWSSPWRRVKGSCRSCSDRLLLDAVQAIINSRRRRCRSSHRCVPRPELVRQRIVSLRAPAIRLVFDDALAEAGGFAQPDGARD